MSTSKDKGTDQPIPATMGLVGLTSGELSLNEFIQKSGQPVIDMQVYVNTTFQAGVGRLLTVNDMHGNRVMREAVMEELGSLCRFAKKLVILCLSQSLKTKGSEE